MIDELPLANNIFSPKDRKSGEHVAEINVFIYYEIGEEGEEGGRRKKETLFKMSCHWKASGRMRKSSRCR